MAHAVMSALASPDATTPADWFRQLYGHAEEGWVTVFSVEKGTGKRHTDWAEVDGTDGLAEAALRRAPTSDVWFGAATRTQRIARGKRGGSDECAALPGLWIDVDIDGPGHYQDGQLARDLEHAQRLVAAFPLPPTTVVHSGGGLQAWWLFSEMVTLDDDARELLNIWRHTWDHLAAAEGMTVDNVFDPARIMRLPGTTNRKEGLARPVVVLSADWDRRYGVDDIEQHVDPLPEPAEAPQDAPIPYIGPVRPGDAYNMKGKGADILARNGFTFGRADSDGEHWVRPGKDPKDGTSATVYADDGHTTIWSDSVVAMWPTLEVRRPYDPFGLYTHMNHRGDWRAATNALRAEGWGDPGFEEVDSLGELQEQADEVTRGDWSPVDLSEILAGNYDPPEPTILRPPVGPALFYPGRCNAVFGESGAGKTWVALAAIVEVIRGGGVAMLIDLEDTASGIVSRLIALGLTPAEIAEHFMYLSPQTGWGLVAQAAVSVHIEDRKPSLVVLDSTGEAMAAGGVKGNDDDDVARWFVTFPKFIARLGPAVLIIDHVPKDPNAPTRYMIGSQRKTAAIDGASYRVDAVKTPSKVADGLLKVICAKDRHGNHTQGQPAAMVSITHRPDGGVHIGIAAPAASQGEEGGDDFRPTVYMERVSRVLEENPGLSGRAVENRVDGKAKYIREATRLLITERFIEQDSSARGFAYRVVTPYREESDLKASHVESDPTASRVPTASPPRPESPGTRSRTTASRVPPPLGGTRSGRPVPTDETVSKTADRVPTGQPSAPSDDDPLAAFLPRAGK